MYLLFIVFLSITANGDIMHHQEYVGEVKGLSACQQIGAIQADGVKIFLPDNDSRVTISFCELKK